MIKLLLQVPLVANEDGTSVNFDDAILQIVRLFDDVRPVSHILLPLCAVTTREGIFVTSRPVHASARSLEMAERFAWTLVQFVAFLSFICLCDVPSAYVGTICSRLRTLSVRKALIPTRPHSHWSR